MIFSFNIYLIRKRERIINVLDNRRIIEREVIKIMNSYTCSRILLANTTSQVENVACDYLRRSASHGKPWQLSQDLNFPRDANLV